MAAIIQADSIIQYSQFGICGNDCLRFVIQQPSVVKPAKQSAVTIENQKVYCSDSGSMVPYISGYSLVTKLFFSSDEFGHTAPFSHGWGHFLSQHPDNTTETKTVQSLHIVVDQSYYRHSFRRLKICCLRNSFVRSRYCCRSRTNTNKKRIAKAIPFCRCTLNRLVLILFSECS